jgi:hypothetical protein
MTLTTAATVTLERLQYTVQIRSVHVELALLPGTNRADVLIAAGVDVEATPGADATVELAGGDGAATVITGTVDSVERHSGGTLVSITDGGAALATIRPNETYNGMLATQIIMQLAQAAGVETGLVVATTQTAAYVADPRRTGAHHVAALAERAGGVAAFDGDGRLNVLPWPIGLPTAAMRRDREFTSIAASAHRPQHEVALVGSGGSGAALSPDAWVMSTDAITGADDPDPARSWRADAVLRTATDVDLANESLTSRRAAATRRLRAECWLQPGRRPGDVVQIQQADHPDEEGPWLIVRILHDLGWDRSRSVLSGVTAGETSSLLGALAGAVGSFL